MPEKGRIGVRIDAEAGWWAISGLTVASAYALGHPKPPFPEYSLWLEGVSLWLQLAVGPALLLALGRRLLPRRRDRRETAGRPDL